MKDSQNRAAFGAGPFRRHHDPRVAALREQLGGRGHGFDGPALGRHPGFGGFGRDGHGPGFGPGGFGPGFGPGGFGPRGFGPGPHRKRRGDVRLAILSLLSDAAANGYGLIKAIGERSGGTWTPSPGSVYPTLQQLVDEELVEATGEGRRTEFQLTDAGRAYVAEHADELAAVWASSQEQAERDAGLGESVGKLMAAVGQLRFGASAEQRERAAGVLDDARKALYAILAE
ncbi:PadR family transcriptional regulator [Galbitalea sp. SE-J8]|uniref:PadR family transcriptional regulator n=1 Tax=Galbitalea sp. SE-J8 TaxID=3054952 RepID=UPI00259CC268|nr:PadR family transcriptional regulator [Galbitalea sp. SE-J8]MDM4762899.1 PadR family transcriptional regulator [Galbitalea sp. SE-J8]